MFLDKHRIQIPYEYGDRAPRTKWPQRRIYRFVKNKFKVFKTLIPRNRAAMRLQQPLRIL